MKSRFFLLFAIALCSVSYSSGADAFSCYRHIYNKSAAPWILGGSGSYGNVYMWMDQITSRCRKEYCRNGARGCQVPAGCTVEYQMTTTGGRGKGAIVFKDRTGKQGQFPYSFEDQCPYIWLGSGGPISLNDPANGDYTIVGNQW
jgi:hypothetical protein